MTLEACYAAMGGDYDTVLGRLHSAKMIQKFMLKFLDDPSYELLNSSLAAGDYNEAFRAAHTLKGVCQNLEFCALYQSSHELCEALRDGTPPDSPALFEQVQADYKMTTDAIRTFKAELPE